MNHIKCKQPDCKETVFDAEGCPGYIQTRPHERGWVKTEKGWFCPKHAAANVGGMFAEAS